MKNKTGNGPRSAAPDQPVSMFEKYFDNLFGNLFGNLWASWCVWVSRLNARIDAQPMPRHHRLGSWQHIKREELKREHE
ncbi:hypothetical protein [Undibacterium pigrum]|uniref:Uncharacterized protein n=1 Tax=Undibacterium pigrum TaxID=401470 RepID=A0A318J2Q6_9BURK|nr:hypothetical protein [Undibacterium pigrum]PXX41916.1 hypothetical protein DFR42_10695 [Undibacterium pigrum]